jgi:hypothetical protein
VKKLFIFFLILIGASYSIAQTVDGNFVITTNNGTTYSVKVQIKLQSGSETLGNATIRFSFNNSDLSFPASPSEGTDYSFHNFQGGGYSSSVSRPQTNVVSINIAWLSGGTDVTTGYIDVATINFSTLDALGNSNLVWGTRELFSPGGSTQWTLGSWPNQDTPLPVELSSFAALVNKNAVNLTWQTRTEVNNYGFEIERTSKENMDKLKWEKIGFIKGNGNSNSPKEYSYIDKNLTGGSKFAYRLKQIDNDGKFTYSNVVEIELQPAQYALYQNYPNPFNPSTTIRFSLPETKKVRLTIYNILGEQIAALVNESMEAGFYNIKFDGSNYSSGVYIFMLEGDDFIQSRMMHLVK